MMVDTEIPEADADSFMRGLRVLCDFYGVELEARDGEVAVVARESRDEQERLDRLMLTEQDALAEEI